MTQTTRATRPGGRSTRVRAAVHEAVVAELVERGFDELTVDRVAERAGVHRTTVYRRWRDVGGLLTDLVDVARDTAWTPPDTGSLQGDLIAVNHELHAALIGGSPITLALIAASFRSPAAATALHEFWTDRVHRCAPVVHRAAQRGEIPVDTDPHQVALSATGPLFYGIVLMREPISAAESAEYARITARGVCGRLSTED
jgi:AcrR family transcriptional regulator